MVDVRGRGRCSWVERMNLPRIFANAIARRVAFVLVAVALAWLGIGSARAQAYPDEGSAYSACMVNAAMHVEAMPTYRYGPHCQKGHANFYTSQFWSCSGSGHAPPCSIGVGSIFEYINGCSARPSQTTLFYPPSGSVACNDGCAYKYRETGDGETTVRSPTGSVCADKPDCAALDGNYIWNGHLKVCQPVAPECPEGQKAHGSECVPDDSCPDGMALQNGVCTQEEDTCPPGNIRSPEGACLPGEGQCAAGEARRENGTCGKDSDGDGEADEDDEDPENDPDKPSASGGDSCDSPPSCSGDVIACMQVKIQWRIDCNTRNKANISGGHCGAGGMPVCRGDGCKATEYAALIQQWKASCLLEKIAASDGGSAGGDSTAEYLANVRAADVADANSVKNEGDGHEGVTEESIFHTFSNEDFNPNLFGGSGGGSCSFSTQLEVLGKPITLPPSFWTLANMIGWLIVAAAYIWVAFQLGGK